MASSSEEMTDVFLTHDWGTDEHGRNNHDRVSKVNTALKQLGYKTWFDSDRMTGDIIDKMCDGIDKTKIIIVFVTKRYADKVQSGQDNDNCKLEFKYAMRRKGAGYMIPVVMEERMRNPGLWEGPVGMALGGVLAVRMFSDFGENESFLEGMREIKQEIDVRLRSLAAIVPEPIQQAPVPIQPAPVPVQPAPVPIQPAPVPVQPAPVPVQPAPVPVQPAPVPVQPAPVPVQPAPVQVQPAPSSNNIITIPRISKGRITGSYALNLKKKKFRF